MLDTPSAKGKTEAVSTNTSNTTNVVACMELPTDTPEKELQFIEGIKLYSVLVGIALVAFLVMLDQTVLTSAVPKISVQFNSLKDIGWYGSSYLLTTASMQPLMGKFYQNYSSKTVFLSCVSIFEVASLICGVAQSSKMLIVGRAIAGVGGAGLFTGIITIIAACVPADKRPVYMGMTMGLASIGLVCGPILGGVFTQYASWRWCFFINLPFGVFTVVVLSIINIPQSHVESDTKASLKEQILLLDPFGYGSFLPAVVMLLLAIQWGGVTYAWNSAIIIGLFCGSGAALVLFVLLEKKAGDRAVFPLTVICQRKVVCSGIVSLFSSGGGLLIAYYLPIWFQVVQGTSPTMGGVRILPTIGALASGSAIAGALVSRIGYFTPFAIMGSALGAIGAGLISTLHSNSGAAMWIGFQIFAGVGRGFTMQQSITAVQTALPAPMFPIGTAFIMFIQILGGTLLISFGQTVFTNELKSALAHFAPAVDYAKILGAGATGFKNVVTPDQVAGVVQAYNQALTKVFYLGIAAGCASFVASFGMGWTNIKTKESTESTAEKA